MRSVISRRMASSAVLACLVMVSPVWADGSGPAAKAADGSAFPRTVTIYGINDVPVARGAVSSQRAPGTVVRSAESVVRLKASPLGQRALEQRSAVLQTTGSLTAGGLY